jgi:hypothetical protein
MRIRDSRFAVAGAEMLPKLILNARPSIVIILADNDEPGRKQAAKAARAFKAQGRSVRVAFPPEGAKDLNELVNGKTGEDLAAGYAAVRKAIENASEPVEEPGSPQSEPGGPSDSRSPSGPSFLYPPEEGEPPRPLANYANLVTLLETDSRFINLFRYNTLALVVDVLEPIPRPIGKTPIPDDGPYPRILTETDVSRLLECPTRRDQHQQPRDRHPCRRGYRSAQQLSSIPRIPGRSDLGR